MKPAESYVVICRADRQEGGTPGDYELATRAVFPTKEGAEHYAEALSESRAPLVVSGRWTELRFGQETNATGRPATRWAHQNREPVPGAIRVSADCWERGMPEGYVHLYAGASYWRYFVVRGGREEMSGHDFASPVEAMEVALAEYDRMADPTVGMPEREAAP